MVEKTRPEFLALARNPYSGSQAREIGRRLRAARLAQRLDLASLAAGTFARPSDLEALERGEFDRVTGRLHLPVFLRVYGDHLRLDGEALARPHEALAEADRLAPVPEPRPRERGGLRRPAVATTVALLLLGAVAGAGYHASHRPGPGTAEAIKGVAPPVADAPHGAAGRADDAPLAATAPAGIPGPAPAAAVGTAVPSGGETPADSVAHPAPAATPSPVAVEPSTAEVAPVPQAEPRGDRASAAAGELPEGLGARAAPELAAASGGEPLEGGRADITRPAAPAPVEPGAVGLPPDAVEEPVASGEPAPLGAPASPATAAEPIAAPAARAEAAAPAARFAIYFFSVRPPARVAREWRRLAERYPDLADLEPRPTRPVAIPGQGTFYRIEAGAFATRAAAQAVCDRLHARGQSCKVLVP